MFLNPLLSVVLSCVCQCTVMQVTVYSVSLRFLLRSVTQGLLLNRSARAAGLGVPFLIYRMSATTTHRSLLPDLLFTDACSRARSQSYLCALLLPHRSSLVSRGSRVPFSQPRCSLSYSPPRHHQPTWCMLSDATDAFKKVSCHSLLNDLPAGLIERNGRKVGR